MEKLPTEIILKQILEMSYDDILNFCKTNKDINSICKANKEYIFRKILQRDFGINRKTIFNLYSHPINKILFLIRGSKIKELVEIIQILYSLSYEKKLNTNVLKNLFRSKKTFLNNLSRQTLQSIDFYNQMETLEALKDIQNDNDMYHNELGVSRYLKIMRMRLDMDKRLIDPKFCNTHREIIYNSFGEVIVMFGSLDLIKTFIPLGIIPGMGLNINEVALLRGDFDIIDYLINLIKNMSYTKTHLREMGVQENIIDKLDQKIELIEDYGEDWEPDDWEPDEEDNGG